MDNQLHAAGERAGRPHKNARRRAGLPAKRFFTRFTSMSDLPSEDLELLFQGLRKGLNVDPSSPVPALHALVMREIRKRTTMNHQPQTAVPEAVDAARPMDEPGPVLQPGQAPWPGMAEHHGRSRRGYLDPKGPESTRELRDTARRRRDAEEKLQQHLLEAKDHVPNGYHGQPRRDPGGE